jgi:DNA-binding beta-propeller fold protein YncE
MEQPAAHSRAAFRAALILAGLAIAVALALPAAAGTGNPPIPKASFLAFITQDEEGGPLYFPYSIFIDRGRDEAYIIDGKGRVIIYSSSFFPLATIGKGSGLLSPTAVAVDRAGNVYVTQAPGKGYNQARISVLDACLKPVRQIDFAGFPGAEQFSPQRLALRPDGTLFAVGYRVQGIVVISPDGKQQVINPAAKDYEADPNFSAVACDEAGNLYAVSEEMGRVYVLDGGLKPVRHFGMKGGSSGKLSRPQGVAADPKRSMFYIVDYMRHAVSFYDGSGAYLNELGGLGLGAGWLQFPKDVGVDSAGRIFVVDTFNQRVQVFEIKWELGGGEAGPQLEPAVAAPTPAEAAPAADTPAQTPSIPQPPEGLKPPEGAAKP